MRTITVRLKQAPDFYVEATTDATNKPLVVLDSEADLVEDIDLSPGEAERLGRALMRAASAARAKKGKYGRCCTWGCSSYGTHLARHGTYRGLPLCARHHEGPR